ncbi:MAG: hypothetical protein KTR25_14025 [Myxococcales bacterium]|nr:hypothetical protein [Myxococcales bacterium]
MFSLYLITLSLLTIPESMDPKGEVTMPLSELVRLQSAARNKEAPEDPKAPISYFVEHMVTDARLIGDGIDATAQVSVRVFGPGWVTVPLLAYDESLQLIELPTLSNADVVAREGMISLLTRATGRFQFQLRFLKYANNEENPRGFDLQVAIASRQELRLIYDTSEFILDTPPHRVQGDAAVFFPKSGAFQLQWRSLSKQPTTAKLLVRAPLDPVITQAHSSIVVTLDGQQIARHHYELRLQGEKTLEITLPDKDKLNHIYLNGVSQDIETSSNPVKLKVHPPRQGEETGFLELVIRRERDPLALSGILSFFTPGVSWDINQSSLVLHLPSVFNYTWIGGSLSPTVPTDSIKFTWDIPTPGKTIYMSQKLVRQASDAQLQYTVDLKDKYYR